MSDNFEKTVIRHECDYCIDNCIPVKSIESELRSIISTSKWKLEISMEYMLCRYFGGISRTNISKIVMCYVPIVITINASGIDDSTVDFEFGVKLDNNTYFPNYIMTVRVDEVVPNYNTFSVTTKNNDYVVDYNNNVCLHDVTEMFVRELYYII